VFKTSYRTVILSTHIFKIIAGKALEENIKKISYLLMAPLERKKLELFGKIDEFISL
jgi:hypothetical protein